VGGRRQRERRRGLHDHDLLDGERLELHLVEYVLLDQLGHRDRLLVVFDELHLVEYVLDEHVDEQLLDVNVLQLVEQLLQLGLGAHLHREHRLHLLGARRLPLQHGRNLRRGRDMRVFRAARNDPAVPARYQ